MRLNIFKMLRNPQNKRTSFFRQLLGRKLKPTERHEVEKLLDRNYLRQFIGFAFNVGLIYLIYQISKDYMKLEWNKQIPTPKQTTSSVSLSDVVGIEEYRVELLQIIDFIRNPEKYKDIGAVVPKGVLLSGEPGIGKTMLAKALANETNVSFIYKSGSEFDTKYLGESSKNVHKIFVDARKSKPCILFIDEIDSIGGKRSGRENKTFGYVFDGLNQLLYEMDGFEKEEGVLVVAATNRISDLDPALLRPGRFDRILRIPTPNKKAREALMDHYLKKVKFDGLTFKREYFLDRTSGFTGAEIRNVFNLAALNAGFNSQEELHQTDVEKAIDRVIHGNLSKNNELNKKEEQKMAYSQAALAVMAHKVGLMDTINKLTLERPLKGQGRGGMIEHEKTDLLNRKELLAKMQMYLTCKVSEEMEFGSDQVSMTCVSKSRLASQVASKLVANNMDGAKGSEEQRIVLVGGEESDLSNYELENRKKAVLKGGVDYVREILVNNQEKIKKISEALLSEKTLTRENLLVFLN